MDIRARTINRTLAALAVAAACVVTALPAVAGPPPGRAMGLRLGDAGANPVVIASGAQWAGIHGSWRELEPTQGVYREDAWQRLEAWARDLSASGRKVHLIITDAPAWATDGVAPPSGSSSRPDGAALPAYARFLGDLSRRIGPYINAWSPWNEPNNYGFYWPVDPAAYVQLQKAAYGAIKAGDPASVVLGGPVLTLLESRSWLAGAYASGLRGTMDAIAINAYPMFPPDETHPTPQGDLDVRSLIAGLTALHRIIQANDPGRPVWITEMSWSTCAGGWGYCVSEADQARFLQRAYRLIWRHAPWVAVTFWYTGRDGSSSGTWWASQGLERVDGTPKPALGAFAQLATGRAWAAPRARRGGVGQPTVRVRRAAPNRLVVTVRSRSAAAGRMVVSASDGGTWTTVARAAVPPGGTMRADLVDKGYTGLRVTQAGRSRAQVVIPLGAKVPSR